MYSPFFSLPIVYLVESEHGRMYGTVFSLEPFRYVCRQLPDRNGMLYTDESSIPLPAPSSEAESNRFVCILLPHGSYATFSNFFMTEKMNTAETRHTPTNTPHTIHRGISPQIHAATAVK